MPNWLLILPHSSPICLLLGMSHEPKSPSLGMISTATRTTATVSPLTPSPLNGSIVANGSPATQSAHSGFAAALRKLAKQAEEPRGKTRQLIWLAVHNYYYFCACGKNSNCYDIIYHKSLANQSLPIKVLALAFLSICLFVLRWSYITLACRITQQRIDTDLILH